MCLEMFPSKVASFVSGTNHPSSFFAPLLGELEPPLRLVGVRVLQGVPKA